MTARWSHWLNGKPPARILVIPLRYIGDTVVSVPLIRQLAQLFPAAQIDVLASATTAPLLEPSPYIHQVLIEPKGSGARLSLLNAGRYDAVFMLRKSVSLALMCRLAGIPTVVGYDKQRFPWGYRRWGWFLDAKARYPSLRTETPQVLSHLSLLSAVGLPLADSALELWHTDADAAKIEALLGPDTRPIAAVHLAAASHGKTIDPSRFVPALQSLNQAGYRLVTTGLPSDAALYEELSKEAGVPLLNLAGQTSLRETVALYRGTRILLTLDSGPIHLGAAAGVPQVVGVFGPTNEKQWGPHNAAGRFYPVFVDLPCRPCYAKVCSHNNCKVTLEADQITTAVQAAISGGFAP